MVRSRAGWICILQLVDLLQKGAGSHETQVEALHPDKGGNLCFRRDQATLCPCSVPTYRSTANR
jgi:hypothetical protein